MDSRKYGRTYHYPFSPGTTSDDRIRHDYRDCMQQMKRIIHTEKLDGENNCLSRYGVFARSHAAPTTSPWTSMLRQFWQLIKNDLGDLELFGENLYAVHSIEYRNIDQYYYVFAARYLDQWLSWEEVCFYAAAFDLPTVPVLQELSSIPDEPAFRAQVEALASAPSVFGSVDILSQQPCSREGIVTRDMDGFPADALGTHVFKYVRKGHVKTDEHWTRNWKRARLNYELKK